MLGKLQIPRRGLMTDTEETRLSRSEKIELVVLGVSIGMLLTFGIIMVWPSAFGLEHICEGICL